MVSIAKRFYKTVAIEAGDFGFALRLDTRMLRTPLGRPFRLTSAALAEVVASEWRNQGETIQPHTMPMTLIVNSAIDRVGSQREAVIESVLDYARTDLVCYRAADPHDLVARQEALWQPLVEWLVSTVGSRLRVTTGILPIAQDDDEIERLRPFLARNDDLSLTALASAVQASGSAVIGLALVNGWIDEKEAFVATFVDELYQEERWGEDAEATARRVRVADDLAAAGAIGRMIRSQEGGGLS